MTAKEKLRQTVETLSEEEAEDALRLLRARKDDPLMHRLDNAPLEDEEISEEEEAAVAEGRADVAAGRTVSLDEAMREFE